MNAMKKMIAVAAVAVAGFAAFAAGEGAAPTSSDTYSFTYQACLRDEHGNVITKDGAVQRNQVVILRLWPTAAEGGTPLWARKFAVFTDETGLFNLEVSDSVGSQEPALTNSLAGAISSQKAGQLYIGLEVENSAGEIVPRQRVFAVPFASVANDVRAITQDIPVSGTLTFAKGSEKVVVSADGISQKGEKSSSFHAVEATKVVAQEVKVATIEPNAANPTVTVKANLDVENDATVQGAATVSGDATVKRNATVNGKLTVGSTPVMDVVVPVGGIIMWTKPQLPDNEHWAICDGNTYNGVTTPNLKDRFVVGAGGNYQYGATGGETTVKLTGEQVPLREHSHIYWGDINQKLDLALKPAPLNPGYGDPNFYANNSSSHSFSISYNYETSKAGGDNSNIQAHENRPPYYALYYIMRVK